MELQTNEKIEHVRKSMLEHTKRVSCKLKGTTEGKEGKRNHLCKILQVKGVHHPYLQTLQ